MVKLVLSLVLLATLSFQLVLSRVDLQDQDFVQDQEIPDQTDEPAYDPPQSQAAVCQTMRCYGGLLCLSSTHFNMIMMAVAFSILILVALVSFLTAKCSSNKFCQELCGCCGAGRSRNQDTDPNAENQPIPADGDHLEEVVTGDDGHDGDRSGYSEDGGDGSYKPKYLKVENSSSKKRKLASVSSTSDVSDIERQQYVRQSPDFKSDDFDRDEYADKHETDGNKSTDDLVDLSAAVDTTGNTTTSTADASGAVVGSDANSSDEDANSTVNDSARLIQDNDD